MDDDGLAISGENRETEADKIERWRISVCIGLGYEPEDALSIAVSDADLHYLEDRLIRRGCPIDLAARII